MRRSLCALSCLLAGLTAPAVGTAQAPAASPVGLEVSPGVAFNPHGPDTRAVGLRRLSADETRLVQARAERFYAAVRAAAVWRTPVDRAHLFTTTAAIEPPGVLQHDLTAYWTVPRDARRRPDGVLTPLLGGAHDLVYFRANWVPRADQFIDRTTRGEFTREAVPGSSGGPGGVFAAPPVLGELGGGSVFADLVFFTRDGRSPLEPAPIGPLLRAEVERLRKQVRDMENGAAQRLKEAEAAMSPERVAERRANREAVWSRETRDPAQLAQRLDAAHRTDQWSLERERLDFTPPAEPDPRNRFWGPRLALQAAERTLAAVEAQGAAALAGPACGRMEPGFATSLQVRFEAATGRNDVVVADVARSGGCVPMVQVRADLLDPRRPPQETQTFGIWFAGSGCGEPLAGKTPLPRGGRCGYGVPMLREMDWALVRQALGW
jgi:hypothetical protein